MLSYRKMERHFQLLQLVDKYKQQITSLRSGGLKAASFGGTPKAQGSITTDRIGETVISIDRLQSKLLQLEALANSERPEVEETIKLLTAGSGKYRIRTELILTMHYLNGRSLEEIAEILHIKSDSVKQAIQKPFEKSEEAEHGKNRTN